MEVIYKILWKFSGFLSFHQFYMHHMLVQSPNSVYLFTADPIVMLCNSLVSPLHDELSSLSSQSYTTYEKVTGRWFPTANPDQQSNGKVWVDKSQKEKS